MFKFFYIFKSESKFIQCIDHNIQRSNSGGGGGGVKYKYNVILFLSRN